MNAEKKRNIVMLGHKRIPSREGGVEIVVEELSTRMAARGHQVTCLNRKGHHVSGKEFDTGPRKEFKGVKLETVFALNYRGVEAMTASVTGAFRTLFGGFDTVHFHAEGPCAMLWLPKLFGKRCIVTVHGLDHQRPKWGKFARAYILFGEKVAVRWADEIIVLSKGVQEYFRSTYGRETVFIPNGVTRPQIAQASLITEKYGLKKDEYILFLGRIVPEKGLRYLVSAFRQVKTDKKLVIAGGSSDTDAFFQELRAMAEGDDRILFTGFVQGQLLEELYSNAYIYTLTSDVEGMPLSLLEAMSYGNCCLTSDISECTEAVEDKAISFPAGNVQALRDTLQGLCDSPEAVARYKAGAADYICDRFQWETIVDRTLDLYDNRECSRV